MKLCHSPSAGTGQWRPLRATGEDGMLQPNCWVPICVLNPAPSLTICIPSFRSCFLVVTQVGLTHIVQVSAVGSFTLLSSIPQCDAPQFVYPVTSSVSTGIYQTAPQKMNIQMCSFVSLQWHYTSFYNLPFIYIQLYIFRV